MRKAKGELKERVDGGNIGGKKTFKRQETGEECQDITGPRMIVWESHSNFFVSRKEETRKKRTDGEKVCQEKAVEGGPLKGRTANYRTKWKGPTVCRGECWKRKGRRGRGGKVRGGYIV